MKLIREVHEEVEGRTPLLPEENHPRRSEDIRKDFDGAKFQRERGRVGHKKRGNPPSGASAKRETNIRGGKLMFN